VSVRCLEAARAGLRRCSPPRFKTTPLDDSRNSCANRRAHSPLIVDHFDGTIGGFARRIVTLELTSFARCSGERNAGSERSRGCRGLRSDGDGGGRRRRRRRRAGEGYKTEKRNKGPIKTNWSFSPRPFVRRSARRRAQLVGQILRSFRGHTRTSKCARERSV